MLFDNIFNITYNIVETLRKQASYFRRITSNGFRFRNLDLQDLNIELWPHRESGRSGSAFCISTMTATDSELTVCRSLFRSAFHILTSASVTCFSQTTTLCTSRVKCIL